MKLLILFYNGYFLAIKQLFAIDINSLSFSDKSIFLIDKKNSKFSDNTNIEKYRQHIRRNFVNETKSNINLGISFTDIVIS